MHTVSQVVSASTEQPECAILLYSLSPDSYSRTYTGFGCAEVRHVTYEYTDFPPYCTDPDPDRTTASSDTPAQTTPPTSPSSTAALTSTYPTAPPPSLSLPSSPSSTPTQTASGAHAGGIAGGVVRGLAVLGAVVLGMYHIRRHRAEEHAVPEQPEMPGQEAKSGWELDASSAVSPVAPHEAPGEPVGVERRAELG